MKWISKRRIMSFIFMLILILVAGCVYKSKLPPLCEKLECEKQIFITNVDLFNGDPDQGIMENVNILIENGRIIKIGKFPPSGVDAEIIDGKGKMVIPGLIDAHTHVVSPGSPPWFPVMPGEELIRRNFSSYLYAGITTVYDMGGPLHDLEKIKTDIETEEQINPRFFYAGKMLTQKGGHPERMLKELIPWPVDVMTIGKLVFLIDAPADIAPAIKENKAHGATLTKIMVDQIPFGVPSLREPLIEAIVSESKKTDLMVCAHIGSETDLLTALNSGVRFFAHTPYRSSISDTTTQSMGEKEIVVIPTLVAFDQAADFFADTLSFSDLEKEIIEPNILEAYINIPDGGLEAKDPQFQIWIHELQVHREIKYENVRKMKAAGVTLIAGSDSPNVAAVAGGSLHKEMRLLVEKCGFTPMEAVASATSVSGDILGRITGVRGLGRIVVGGPADLVMLNGDFREDIRRTENIHMVVSNGRIVERKIQ